MVFNQPAAITGELDYEDDETDDTGACMFCLERRTTCATAHPTAAQWIRSHTQRAA